MVVFANEPPVYREAMCFAFDARAGVRATSLPLRTSVEDGLDGARVVVTSGLEETARLLSRRVAVVNLRYGPRERVAVFQGGRKVEERALEGIGDLVSLIEETLIAVP